MTSVSHDSVSLSWDDPDDDSITGYLVLRRDVVNQAPGVFSTIESDTGSSATTYTDNTVSAETRYTYRVKAINPEGTSKQSKYVNVNTPAGVPAAPTGLTTTSVSHDSVSLSWDDPDDDSITGYLVLRRDVVNQEPGVFSTIESDTGSSATTYTDNAVSAETRYTYRVKAINPEGTSKQSNYIKANTPAAPPPDRPSPLTRR
jgi:chitodextrinase